MTVYHVLNQTKDSHSEKDALHTRTHPNPRTRPTNRWVRILENTRL
jgi:hypothetical protein